MPHAHMCTCMLTARLALHADHPWYHVGNPCTFPCRIGLHPPHAGVHELVPCLHACTHPMQVYMSGHTQHVPVGSILHDVTVHFLSGLHAAQDAAAISVSMQLPEEHCGTVSTGSKHAQDKSPTAGSSSKYGSIGNTGTDIGSDSAHAASGAPVSVSAARVVNTQVPGFLCRKYVDTGSKLYQVRACEYLHALQSET